MNIKKYLGNFTLILAALTINNENASFFTIGSGKMPESIRKLR